MAQGTEDRTLSRSLNAAVIDVDVLDSPDAVEPIFAD